MSKWSKFQSGYYSKTDAMESSISARAIEVCEDTQYEINAHNRGPLYRTVRPCRLDLIRSTTTPYSRIRSHADPNQYSPLWSCWYLHSRSQFHPLPGLYKSCLVRALACRSAHSDHSSFGKMMPSQDHFSAQLHFLVSEGDFVSTECPC